MIPMVKVSTEQDGTWISNRQQNFAFSCTNSAGEIFTLFSSFLSSLGYIKSDVERMPELNEKTDRLAMQALEFHRNLASTERTLSCKCSFKFWLILFVGIALVALAFVVFIFCGIDFECRSKHYPHPQPCVVIPSPEQRLKEGCMK